MPQTPKICTPIETTPTRPPFKARVEAAQSLLRERYPDLFGNDPKPLKIGVHLELLERHPDLDFAGLRRALTLHCGRFAYQKALTKPGAARLDLDGQPDGKVTAEQVEIARQRLAELKAALKAKKAAKSPAPSTPAPTPVPTPPPSPPTPPSAISGRPVLRLKPKASTVVTVATVTRRAKS
jgi:ProP effector